MHDFRPDSELDPRILQAPVRGRNLAHGTLGEELGPRATALVFLRHYG